jgi:hypothetical protein
MANGIFILFIVSPCMHSKSKHQRYPYAGVFPVSLSALRARNFWHSYERVKKCPVRNHCLAQFFGAGLAVCLT